MRKRLLAAVAMAPLVLFGLHPAYAQTTTNINNSTATPQSTAASGDIIIDGGGGVVQPQTGGVAAVTLNSNNSVTNAGVIATNNLDNVQGILVAPGSFTGSIFNQGQITLTESYTPTDSANGDGIPEAPFAQGTNRIGILTQGTLTGDIIHSGAISIQGNNSIGISVAAGLNGSLLSTGTINVTGDNTIGIRTAGEITGALRVGNSISMMGQNAVGVQTTGKIDGALSFYGAVSATGYADPARITGTQPLLNLEKTPADVEQGGGAVQVQGSVTGGIFIGAAPITTVSTDTTTDADGDGIVDSVEGTGSLTSNGTAPALQIGSTAPITIGNFGTTTANSFGLIIEGTVAGSGVFDGFSSTAIDIGAGGGGVNLGGGINIIGSVSSSAYQADATAIHLEGGTVAPTFQNSGAVSATVTSAGANTATTLVIEAGATVNSLVNFGTLVASTTGDAANASVVIDRSGTLNSVENTGSIDAALAPGAVGELITGHGIALDLHLNTTGVTLRQESNGVNAPSIIGDVMLGNGPNTVQLLAGSIQGALSLGTAPSSLTIDNGATYVGALTYGGTALSINVPNGTLQNNATGVVGASNLTVGASGVLTVALDPQRNASTVYTVSGAASFAAGSKIGATLLSTPLSPTTFTIVRAASLTMGSTDTALLTTLPFLFDGSIQSNVAAGTINLTVSTKTPAELGMNRAEASAFPAILAALPQDAQIQTAVVSSGTKAGFAATYDQLLPDSGGDVFQTALQMSKAVSRATADRFDLSTQTDDDEAPSDVGMWASEFYTGIDQAKADNNPFHSAGLGLIGGVDFGGYGATLSLASANVIRPHDAGGDSLNSISSVEGGFYAAPRYGPISIDARVGGGYLKMTDRRQFVASILSGDLSTTTAVSRTAEGDWNGYDLSGHIGAGLLANVTPHLFFQPKVYADFFHVQEDAYNERGGGTSFDLNVSGRTSTQTSATASVVAGMKFGKSFIFSPQIEIGYDDVIQGGPGNTTARFAYGGPSFTVQPNQVGGAAMARFSLKGDGNYVHFSFQGGGEFNSNYHAVDLRAVFRMTY
jgi:hypothetical protein